MKRGTTLLTGIFLVICSCRVPAGGEADDMEKGDNSHMEENSFGEDLDFLKQHTRVILLSEAEGRGMAAVVPEWQARVMTSSCDGIGGSSFGWINYDLIESGETARHINAYGGEDRFWMGPEGGQYSIFFKKGDPFDFEHWQTPAFIDTEAFETMSAGTSEASFRRAVKVRNYSGTEFDLEITRTIRIVSAERIEELLDMEALLGFEGMEALHHVAFESENRVKNSGEEDWTREGGLLSIWILGMYLPSPNTIIIVPYRSGPEISGPVVNDEYFGKVPPERLKIGEKALFFSGDGEYRSKIGLSPERARDVLGSWDASRNVLTLVQFNKPPDAADYVNSMWEIQEDPFSGDVVNCYNDGIPAPGEEPLGPFYELETSSPALALDAGEEAVHLHRTFHFKGSRAKLNDVAINVLGVSLDEAEAVFAVE